jgi:serine/alanine adding enzyme
MNALAASLVRASPVVVHAEADASRWNAYVADHPEATAYHDWEWRGVIERAFGHETRYLVAKTAGGTAGVLPLVIFRSRVFGRFAVSMPFLNYGGVLASSREAEAALLDAAVREAHRADASYLELRHTRQVFPHLQAKRHKVAMVVDLQPSAGQQWQAVDRKVRNQVRKAEKSGLRVLQGHAELAEGFYQVFAHNMRDLGTPVYGRRWFREIVSMFPDSTRLFAVMAGERPVAAALVLWHRSSIEVPWASSLRVYNPQCPNVLLYWEMLRFACERGLRALRSRTLHARRGHVPVQAAVGRGAPRAGLGVLDCRWRPAARAEPEEPAVCQGHRPVAAPAASARQHARPAHRPEHSLTWWPWSSGCRPACSSTRTRATRCCSG